MSEPIRHLVPNVVGVNYYTYPHSLGRMRGHAPGKMRVNDLEAFCEDIRSSTIARLASYCGDLDVAEEAFQEAVVRTCRNWAEVRAMRAPAAWVWRVAMNVVHDHHRRERLHRRHLERERAYASDDSESSSPDVVISMWIERALRGLPDDQRTVLELRYLKDRSIRQVAAELQRPEGTIKSLAHRGANSLRARIA